MRASTSVELDSTAFERMPDIIRIRLIRDHGKGLRQTVAVVQGGVRQDTTSDRGNAVHGVLGADRRRQLWSSRGPILEDVKNTLIQSEGRIGRRGWARTTSSFIDNDRAGRAVGRPTVTEARDVKRVRVNQ
jgi:hypothetical protein